MTQNSINLNSIVDFKAAKDNILCQQDSIADWVSLWWKPIFAEFISTALLVLLGCMTTVALPDSSHSPMYVPLGFGFVVLFNVQVFGHISGAYMNPSVSLAAVLWGKIPISVGICYIVVECLGAIAGYGVLLALSPLDMVAGAVCVTMPMESLSVIQAVGIELVLTMVLNFVNCGVWDPVNKAKQDSVAIKFGLTIAGLAIAGAPLTGASMNPARSLGPAVWTSTWDNHWIYWVAPLIGAVLPVLVYRHLLMKHVPRDEE